MLSSLDKKENIEEARARYHKLQELYKLIPAGCQKYVYKQLKIIRVAIDKRDIFALVKEFEEASRQNRKDDANRLYNGIKDTYKRLPKKYREKVYNRMFKPKTDFDF